MPDDPGPRAYTRWTQHTPGVLSADLVGTRPTITARPADGSVALDEQSMTPDHARLVGVRLIEAACLADGARAIRDAATQARNAAAAAWFASGDPSARAEAIHQHGIATN